MKEQASTPAPMDPRERLYYALTGIVSACRAAPLLDHIATARERLPANGSWSSDEVIAGVDLRAAAPLVPLDAFYERITPQVFLDCMNQWVIGLKKELRAATDTVIRGGTRDLDAAVSAGKKTQTVALNADLRGLERATADLSNMWMPGALDLHQTRADLESLQVRFQRFADELAAAAALDAEQALTLLDSKDVWTVDSLPRGVGVKVLRVLDDDGFIEVRLRTWFRHQPPPRIEHHVWFSPMRSPSNAGTWEQILSWHKRDHLSLPFELRVSEKGKAQLARSQEKVDRPPAQPRNEDPAIRMKHPVLIAKAANAAGMRSDVLQGRIEARKYSIGGPKRGYVAERDHILLAVPQDKRKQVKAWMRREGLFADEEGA